jgi:hypothetical protein
MWLKHSRRTVQNMHFSCMACPLKVTCALLFINKKDGIFLRSKFSCAWAQPRNAGSAYLMFGTHTIYIHVACGTGKVGMTGQFQGSACLS